MKISQGRYCKDSICAAPEDSRDGFKGPETWLIQALNGRYSHREGGYILPASKHSILLILMENGWRGKPRYFEGQKAIFIAPDGQEMNLSQAKRELLTQ